MGCVPVYFPPQINPFFPRATGGAGRVVAREGPHLSKHEPRLSWDEGSAEVFMTLGVLSPLPVAATAPCHLFIQTLMKQHGLLPCVGLGNIHAGLLAQAPCFLLSWLSFPPRASLCLRRGGSEQKIGTLQARDIQQGHGRVGLTAAQGCGYLLWASNGQGLADVSLNSAVQGACYQSQRGKKKEGHHHVTTVIVTTIITVITVIITIFAAVMGCMCPP